MSQPPEVAEINQLLAQAKNTVHATCGSASGLISDTVISIFAQFQQKMISQQMQITQLRKENEDLKKKNKGLEIQDKVEHEIVDKN